MAKESENWVKCSNPAEGDLVRWKEPIWAAPNRPRGKPMKQGDQMVTAEVTHVGEFYEFVIIRAEKVGGSGLVKVKEGEHIRRKLSTIEQGDCYKKAN